MRPTHVAFAFAILFFLGLAYGQGYDLPSCISNCWTSEQESNGCSCYVDCVCSQPSPNVASNIEYYCTGYYLESATAVLSSSCSVAIPSFPSSTHECGCEDGGAGGEIEPSTLKSFAAPSTLATFKEPPTTPVTFTTPTTVASFPLVAQDTASVGEVETSVITFGGPSFNPTVVTVVVTIGATSAIDATETIATVSAPTGVGSCNSSDNSMLIEPLNWVQYGVDEEFKNWWQSNVPKKGNLMVSQALGRLFGNVNFLCGIGAGSTCVAPSCTDVMDQGYPTWSYFAANAFVEFNELMNNMVEGISAAESQLNSLIPNLAQIFATPSPSQSPVSDAIPWVETAIDSVLSFIPIIGPLFRLGGAATAAIGGVSSTSQLLVNGGLDTLRAGDPKDTALQDLSAIGVAVHDDFQNASSALQDWSASLLDGQTDASGHNLIDYFKNGRFALGAAPDTMQIGEYFFQQALARLANLEWKMYNNGSDSDVGSESKYTRTFVTCANATNVPCANVSRAAVGSFSCCLYGLDGGANFVDPPGFANLTSAPYGLPPANISASALQSYLIGGFAYNDSSSGGGGGASSFEGDRESAIRTNPSAQTFLQGVSAPGVFTLPVCNTPHSEMVANYADDTMPCCCGPGCNETQAFADATGLSSVCEYVSRCQSQGYQLRDCSEGARRKVERWVWMPLTAAWSLWMWL